MIAGATSADLKMAAIVGGVIIVAYYIVTRDVLNVAGKTAAFVSDPKNPINTVTDNAYKGVTGSEQGMGADFYDLHHDQYGNIKGGALAHPDIWLLDQIVKIGG